MGEGSQQFRWQEILSVEQYRSVLHGNRPELRWSDSRSVPVKPGDVVVLSAMSGPDIAEDLPQEKRWQVAATHEGERVTLTITGLRRAKKGAVVAEYRLRDDRPLYMARGSGLTRDPLRSIDPDADVPEADYLRRLCAEKDIENQVLRRRQRARAQELALEAELASKRERALTGRSKRATRAIIRHRRNLSRRFDGVA